MGSGKGGKKSRHGSKSASGETAKRSHSFEDSVSKRHQSSTSDDILINELNKTNKKVTVEDLDKVENAIDTLGQSLRTIMDLTPDIFSHKDPLIQNRLDAPRIKLAQYLMGVKHLGMLGKVEQLVTNSQGTLERLEPASILPASSFKNTLATMVNNPNELSASEAGAIKQGAVFMSKKELLNKSNKVANWPPPLPKITDANLERQVFTHKSVANIHDYLTEVELLDVHNERLEFLGDSIVNSLIAVIAYDRFPYMHEGDLSNIRTALITNYTMSEWAKIYGLDKKLKFYEANETKKADVVGGRGGLASTPKYIADVFEAYVGGLWVHYGGSEAIPIIRPWLEDLASPMLESIESAQVGNVPLDYEAKKSLYVKIGSATASPQYVTTQSRGNGNSTVECQMNGEVLATATARTAKEAGLRAAMKVLQNPELVNKYAKLRRDIPRVIPPDAGKAIISTDAASTPAIKVPAVVGDPHKLQLDFISEHEVAFAKNPKKFFESLVGDRKDLINYATTEKGKDESGNPVFEAILSLDGIQLSTATGHSAKSAQKRAAYFSMSTNYKTIHEWMSKYIQD